MMDNLEPGASITKGQRIALWIAISGVLAVLLINIFLIGGVDFVGSLDALLPIPIALLAVILLFRLWRATVPGEVSRRIWGFLLLGMLLWFIAEIIWNIYGFVVGELPFPSIADYLWAAGYIFFFLAFLLRFRSLRLTIDRRDLFFLAIIVVPLFILILFVNIIPALQEGADNLLPIFLSIFYPLADLLIPLRALLVILALRQGELNRPWSLLGAAFLTLAVSDLTFTYSDMHGLYWPENQANFLSIFGDWTYILAYTLLVLGLVFVPRLVRQAEHPLAHTAAPDPNRPSHPPVLLLTDAAGHICYMSGDTYRMLGLPEYTAVLGKNIAEVLGLTTAEISAVMAQDADTGTARSHQVVLRTAAGGERPAHLAVLPSFDGNMNYIGSNLLLHSWEPVGEQVWEDFRKVLEILRSDEHLVDHSDHGALLSWYFRSQVRVLYVLIARLAGVGTARNMMNILAMNASNNLWHIDFGTTGFDVTDRLALPLPQRAEIYRKLLKMISDYAIVVASYATTEHEISYLYKTLSKEALTVIQDHGMIFPGYTPKKT